MTRLWKVTALSSALLTPPASWSAAEITNAPKAEKTAVQVEKVATGLRHPWGLEFLPDGRFLITERPGTMRIVSTDGKISKSITGVPQVYARGQGGLLDVRLAPDFADTGTVFLSYAEPLEKRRAATSVARAKLILEGEHGRLVDVQVIFRQTPAVATGFHFGSRIVIANDHSLFVTTGDRGYKRSAQSLKKLMGKVIRINADGSPHKDNPNLEGWPDIVWSIGHRNIQGAVLDPETGNLWTVEHGARGGDELNQPQKGKNYGWPTITYGRDYSGAKIGIGTKKEGLEQPIYYWDPSIAVSGLELYSGKLFKSWKGNLLVGGLGGRHIARLVVSDRQVIAQEKLLSTRGKRIRAVREGPDGAVFAITDHKGGSLLRIIPAAGD